MTSTSRGGAGKQPDGSPRRRADAERNIAAILRAATVAFSQRPQASMADVAQAAGVGRVTLYAHFPSREALLEAVLDRAIAQADDLITRGRLDQGPADEAFRRLLRSSWQVLDSHRRLFDTAQRELGPARLRRHHDPALARVETLLVRGQNEGIFRTDLPVSWLVTTVYTLLHAAADDVNADRLPLDAAGHVLEATLMPALAVPGGERRGSNGSTGD